MKLYYDKRLSDPTYYAQIGIRNGKKVTSKNVKKLGKHSELLKITDDPLTYVKEEIKKLNEEYSNGKVSFNYTANYNEKVENTEDIVSKSNELNIGYFFLQYIIKDLGLEKFFNEVTKDKKNTFDCYTILRFLIYERILKPCSKLETIKHLDNYFEQPLFEHQHILRFMDILEERYTQYITTLYQNSNSIVKRNTSVLYYDCTNFYCEIEREDEEYVDEVTGEVVQALRKYGISKEHRPNPIVEMGLFMDADGIPISMSIHPGNTNEQETAIPLENDIIKMIEKSKFIYCADAGLGSYNIREFNSLGGKAFIVTQSIKKLSNVLTEAIFNDCDYHLLSNDKEISLEYLKTFDKNNSDNLNLYNDRAYKIINADKVVDLGLYEEKVLKNGKKIKVKSTGTLQQKIIITFSRKMMEYQRTIRERQIERAKKLIQTCNPADIKKGAHDVRRFIKEKNTTKEKSIKYELDLEKIEKEKMYDGFYAIATNLEDSAQDIIDVMSKRYQIEDCFRIMKSNFNGRPINHRLPNRIKAHFMICFTSLLVYRLIETKLGKENFNITPKSLIDTLNNLNVCSSTDFDYVSLYKGSKTLDALNSLSGLDLDYLHYNPNTLKTKLKKLLK